MGRIGCVVELSVPGAARISWYDFSRYLGRILDADFAAQILKSDIGGLRTM